MPVKHYGITYRLPAKPIKESHAGYLDPDKSARIAGMLRFHRPYTSMKTKYEDFSQKIIKQIKIYKERSHYYRYCTSSLD